MLADRVVGVVGLGIMGGAIARNLIAAGWKVYGFDPDTARGESLAADGVQICDFAELVEAVPVLLSSLSSPVALQTTAEALAGLASAPRVLVELSTLPLADKMAAQATLAAAGHAIIDCPISGTGAQAETRDLALFASGDTVLIAQLAPLFDGFARVTHDLGAYGNGSRMKFVANLLVAIHNVATAEALILARQAGLDLDQVIRLVPTGAGASRIFDLRAPLMAHDGYRDPTMKLSVWQKDMAIIEAFAASVGAPTPLLDATAVLYDAAMAGGHGEHDTASVYTVLDGMVDRTRNPDESR